MKTITNKFKIALVAVGLLAVGTANAQITGTDIAPVNKDVQTGVNKTIRVVDNKGTIKYLQTANGITTLTNTTANKTTTTFQLGGTLNSNTTITLNDGTTDHNFTIDGINFNLANTAAIDPTSGAPADAAATAIGAATGYTILVRDQATGQVKKMLLSDLVGSAQTEYTALAADETANTKDFTLGFVTTIQKVLVFRNGAKLRAGIDYTLAADGVTLTVAPPAAPTTAQDWSIYTDDLIEYYYTK